MSNILIPHLGSRTFTYISTFVTTP
jgi:hypothetical protein